MIKGKLTYNYGIFLKRLLVIFITAVTYLGNVCMTRVE